MVPAIAQLVLLGAGLRARERAETLCPSTHSFSYVGALDSEVIELLLSELEVVHEQLAMLLEQQLWVVEQLPGRLPRPLGREGILPHLLVVLLQQVEVDATSALLTDVDHARPQVLLEIGAIFSREPGVIA